MSQSSVPVLCIVGATGTGKSEAGVAVAKAVDGEVLSADSMQVYRGMDIGTAKLSMDEMQGVPHHLLDVVDPDQPFTVADWTEMADGIIADIHRRGKLPVVVGGTGLYVRSIVEDLQFGGAGKDPSIRDKWEMFLQQEGKDALYEELQKRDFASANRLHKNDVRRVIRALEVFETTGVPLSRDYVWRPRGGRYQAVQIGLSVDRPTLYSRVDARVDKMIVDGLVGEVEGLLSKGYHTGLAAMQGIGYKEIAEYLTTRDGTLEDAVLAVKLATRRFVKRQLSWFRRDERIVWVDRSNPRDDIPDSVFETAFELSAGIQAGRLE